MELTSNVCAEHDRKSKPVYLILIDGEEVCPLCERDRRNEELSQIETKKIESALTKKNYHVFSNQSVLTDSDLLNQSFATYMANEKETEENKERAAIAFRNYKKGDKFNTWLTGPPGVGKSHLAMSILRNLNEAGQQDKKCLFISVDEMLLRIRASFDDKESRYTEYYFADLLSKVDYLVLDDLGAETGGTGTKKKATDFTLRVLYAIANARQNKSTIITTNLTRSALIDMYDPKLVSRLMKDIYQINFKETSDKRIKKMEFEE